MEDNTRVFYGTYDDQPPKEVGLTGEYAPETVEYQEMYGDGYDEDGYAMPGDEDYEVYNEEVNSGNRFHVALNVMDTVSVLAGVVVILVLTALIVSLISWLRTDILHSFVLLQANVQ